MTTADKLTYIKSNCLSQSDCESCKLTAGETCVTKLWREWTDEEIETAYAILFYHTPSYAEEQLEHAIEKAKLSLDSMDDVIQKYCNDCDDCDTCAISEICKSIGGFFGTLENKKETRKAYEIVKDIVDSKETEFVKAGDSVEHPVHYTQNGIECIEAIKASMTADGFMDYCKGNVLKYIWRWRDKGGVEDLEKARVYLGWMIEEANK